MSISGIYGQSGYMIDRLSDAEIKARKREGLEKCETCATRKYKDGSNEGDVSFKSAAHIDPSQSAAKVMAHEQEHVSNAFQKAGSNNGKVVNCSVTLKTAICPECGRSYVSGGVTNTAIKYKTDNSYGANQKSNDYSMYAGKNVDYGV